MSGEQISYTTLAANATAEQLAMIAGCRHLTIGDVRAWVAGAQPRAQLVYAVGFFALKDAATGVAEELLGCEKLGFVYLVQKRIEPFKSLYIAQRSSRPLSTPVKKPVLHRHVQGAM